MPSSGILYPEDVAVLAQAVDEFCRELHIKSDSEECQDAARDAMTIYEHGCHDRDELVARLREQRKQASKCRH